MKEKFEFKEMLNHICARPGMWVQKGTFQGVYSFIMGYTMGKGDTPLSGDNWRTFNYYGCIKFGFPTNYVVGYVFETCSNSDEEAIKLFYETVNEFTALTETMTPDEILKYAKSTFKHKEGKPEKLFRRFYKAFLEGNEKTIKPLIEAHEHQSVLWEGAYPDDVGELLNQIHQTQHIKRIYESADKTKVKLIVADFPAPFEMNFRDGSWKIDASPLINLQMSQKKA